MRGDGEKVFIISTIVYCSRGVCYLCGGGHNSSGVCYFGGGVIICSSSDIVIIRSSGQCVRWGDAGGS